jgi:hypothetical protein
MRVVPLQVDLNVVAPDRRVRGLYRIVLEGQAKSQLREKTNGNRDVAGHQHRMHRVDPDRHDRSLLS